MMPATHADAYRHRIRSRAAAPALDACPHCASTDIALVSADLVRRWDGWCHCNACGAAGPSVVGPDAEVARAWNSRAVVLSEEAARHLRELIDQAPQDWINTVRWHAESPEGAEQQARAIYDLLGAPHLPGPRS